MCTYTILHEIFTRLRLTSNAKIIDVSENTLFMGFSFSHIVICSTIFIANSTSHPSLVLLNCGLVAMILPLKQADIPTIENLFRNESAISVTLTKLKMNSIYLWHAHFITMKERSIKHVYNHSVPCRYHQLEKHTLPWCSVPMATWNFLEPHVNSPMHVLQKENHLCKIITFIV